MYFVVGEILACPRDVPEPIGTSAKSYSVLNVSHRLANVSMTRRSADLVQAIGDIVRLSYIRPDTPDDMERPQLLRCTIKQDSQLVDASER